MKQKILSLYKAKRELTILQGTYAILALASLAIAGTVALINQPIGVAILSITLFLLAILLINLIAWSLLRLFLDN